VQADEALWWHIEMTCEIRKAAEALGISMHDHLVIGRKGHASFRSLGLLC
jgi:DNA repair protein RadC